LKVLRFFPFEGYGFVGDGTQTLKFRVEAFRRKPGEPLPLSGERVELCFLGDRISGVQRLELPICRTGRVKSFDSRKGWGFVEDPSQIYFLHRSEMLLPWIPLIGDRVQFWAGERDGKPRALYPTAV
jgi:cold shock CspA family protein